MANIKRTITKLLLILCGTCSFLPALTIDTTITGTGSPGPYPLGWHFVDTASITVSYTDSARGVVPPCIFLADVNSLLFSEPIDSGVPLSVHYETDFHGLQKTYSLFERRTIDVQDTAARAQLFSSTYRTPFSDDNISISGYKSIGVSFGSQGQLNMEQALEVSIFGKINDNTQLSANLSDQGTTLDGDTREIGEIDRMYVALENPRYSIVVGDQYVSLPPGRLIEGHKKIKGLSAAYKGSRFHGSVYGAISGGKFTVQTIHGQLGFQGPYYLTGSGEADIINPIHGTVKVIVDGNKLREGERRDYLIDYDLGTIRFMPTFPIDDNSVIQVYYEYKSFDYQRTFLGTNLGIMNRDTSLSVDGSLWYETDNKNHPIDIEYDRVTIDSLKKSGDRIPLVPTGREVHPNDVASHSSLYRLYKIEYVDTAKKDFKYVYSPYNSTIPEDNLGYYRVWYTQVADGLGDYREYTSIDSVITGTYYAHYDTLLPFSPDTIKSIILNALDTTSGFYQSIQTLQSSDIHDLLYSIPDKKLVKSLNETPAQINPRGTVYFYVGKNRGNYTALDGALTPRRNVKGEITFSYQPNEFIHISSQLAGEEEDKNLFSRKDDRDNTAAAARSLVTLGNRTFDKRTLWLSGTHRYAHRRFSNEILSSYERRNIWDREFHSTRGNDINTWQAASGGTIVPDISAALSYGQYFSGDSLLTHRVAYSARVAPWDHADLLYSGLFLKHFDSKDTEKLTRDSISALFDYRLFNYGLRVDDEWRTRLIEENSGKLGGGIDVRFKPVSLTQSIYYAQERKGGRHIFLPFDKASHDTGAIFLWNQSIHHSPRDEWKISGTSSYHLQKRTLKNAAESKRSVLLITASNDVASVKAGVSTHLDYRLNSEKASAYVQVPIYVGEGHGTHSFDSVTNWYVIDGQHGDYILQEQEVFNSAGNENIRKSTLQGNWFFKPHSKKLKGILADISWRGSFLIDEHIKLDSALLARDKLPANTWIPGYSSLAKKNDSLITHADIFYRQDIDWRPKNIEKLHGNVFIRPFLRKLFSSDERGLEWGTSFDKTWNKFNLGFEGRMHRVDKSYSYSSDTTKIKDQFMTLKQRFYFIPPLSAFAHETVGSAEKNDPADTVAGPYFRVQPGLTLRLIGKGWAEVSYTWSQVNIDGETEYPMAQGFRSGISHLIDFIIDINVGDHFSIGGSYQGNKSKKLYKKMLHTVSMDVKAYL